MTKQLFTIVTIFLFLSCSKKEDLKKETTKKDLIGNWNVTKVYSKKGRFEAIYNMGMSINIKGDVILKGSDYKMEVLFKEDAISSSGSFKLNTTIKVDGMPNLAPPNIPSTEISNLPGTSGTWEVKNEKITTKIDSKETGINIVAYSKNKIIFSFPISDYIDNKTIEKVNPNIKDVKVTGDLFIEITK